MEKYVPNQQTILVANPNYWAQNLNINYVLQPAHIHEIIINYKTDELTRELDLENGEAQAAVINFGSVSDVLSTGLARLRTKLGPFWLD